MVSRFFLCVVSTLLCASADAAEITAMPLKDTRGIVLIKGELKREDVDVFLAKSAPFSGGIVVMESPGGSAYAGLEIGKAIRERRFTTWVESGTTCASACAIAWLGGEPRVMGKAAVIGFHALSVMRQGERVETGFGNAIYGAYLAKLGLSYKAIEYLSDAAPTDMNWLTPTDAENIGISLKVYDDKPTGPPRSPSTITRRDSESSALAPSSPPVVAPTVPPAPSLGLSIAEMDARSREMVIALNVIMSGPDEGYFKLLNGIYADRVMYFGKQVERAEVVTQVTKFIERWPMRSYVVRPESLRVQCDSGLGACQISGMIDFSAKSVARNQWSRGTATFDYLLAFRPNQKYPVIVNEGGAVVDRQMTALQPAPRRYPNEVDPTR